MWIKTDNEASRRLFDAGFMDEPVEFTENATAQVPEPVGEALVEHYDAIQPYEADE